MSDVLLNIYEWERGDAKLEVKALYDALADRFGPDTPTNYLAKLLAEVLEIEGVGEPPPSGPTGTTSRTIHLQQFDGGAQSGA